MLQIKNLDVHNLRNDEDFGFQSRVYNLGEALLTQEVDKPVLAIYKAALDAFDAALKQSLKNSQTDAVEAADKEVDHLYTGMTLYLRALTYHPSETLRTAAAEGLAIIDKYGALTDLPYNQQYGALHNSMQELVALPDETMATLQLADWLAAISSANARFDTLRSEQTAEQSLYQVGLVKDTRNAADAAYKQFVASVNAFAIAFGEENYASFINQVNVMIADVQAELKARKTRAEKEKAEKEKEEENVNVEDNGTTL